MIAGALEVQLFADIARIKADMEKATGYVSAGADAMEKAARAARVALGGIAAGLSVVALTSWIRGAIDAADTTDKMAQKMGVNARNVAGLELAFKQAGLGSSDMTKAISQLSKEVVENGKGLQALGIKTKTADGQFRGTMAVLYDVADALKALPDGFQKNALAAEIFGAKLGAEMIPLLNGGSAGLREMADMAEKLGLVISDQTAKDADQFNDTVELLGLGTQGVARGIAAQLLPTLTSLAGSFLESMTSGDKLKRTADVLAAGLKILYSVAVGVVEIFSTLGKAWGATFGVIGAAMRGDFTGAVNIAKEGFADIKAGWADTAKSIARAWTNEGNAAVAATAKLAGAQKDLMAAAKAREEAAKKAAAVALKEADDFQKLRDKLEGKSLGVDAGFIETLKMIETEGKKAGLSLTEIIRLKDLYIAQQPYMLEQAKAQKKADEEAAKAVDGLFASRDKLFVQAVANEQKAKDMLAQLQFEAKLIGLSNEERTVAIALRQLEASGIDKTTEAYIKLRGEIEQQVRANAQAEAGVEAAKKVRHEWEDTNKQIADSFVDNLMRGGKSVAQYLKDLFRTLVLRPILQPIGNLMSNMVGSLFGGGQGGGGGLFGQIGQQGISSMLSSGLNNMFGYSNGSSFMGNVGGSIANYVGMGSGAGSAFASGGASSVSFGVGGAGGGASGLAEMGMGSVGTGSGAAGGAMSAMAPFAVLLAPLFAAWADGMFSGESRTGGQYGYDPTKGTTFTRGPDGGDPAAEASTLIVDSTVASINAAMKALGSSATLTGFKAGWEKSNAGRGGVFAGGTFSNGLAFGESGLGSNYGMNGNPFNDLFESWVNDGTGRAVSSPMHNRTAAGPEDLALDAAQSYISAIQASVGLIPQIVKEQFSYQVPSGDGENWDGSMANATADQYVRVFDEAMRQSVKDLGLLPKKIADLIVDIDPEALSAEATKDIASKIQTMVANVNGFNAIVDAMPVEQLKGVIFDVAAGIVELSGGLEAFATNLTAYVDNFYEADEKRVFVAGNIRATLAGAGIDVSVETLLQMTKEGFRAIVEEASTSEKLATEAGQKTYATLLSVAGAMAGIIRPAEEVVEVVDDVAEGLSEAMQRLQADTDNLLVELLRAQGDEPGAIALERTLETAGLTEAEIAIYDRNEALRAEILALNDAARAAEAIAQQRSGLEARLLALAGNTRELRARELATMDATLRPLQERIWALEQEAAIASERSGLETRLLQLQGDTAELRRRELEQLDPSNRALMQMIWSLEDAAAAVKDTTVTLDDVGRAAQELAAREAAAAEKLKSDLFAAYNRERSELQQTIDKHRGFAQSLRQARDAMWSGNDSPLSAGDRTAEALRQYEKTFGKAMSGDLTAIAELQGAGTSYLSALQESSATKADFDFGFARVATGLSLVATRSDALASAAEREMTVMTDQLTALGLLQTTTEQGFDALLAAYLATVGKASDGSAGTGAGTSSGTGDGATTAGGGRLGLPLTDAQLASYASSYAAKGMNADQTYAALLRAGMSPLITQADLEYAARAAGVPGFAVGTNLVPQDMLAFVHRDEAIVPAQYNPAAGGVGGNADLVAELRELRAEVARLYASSERGNEIIKRGADAVNGQPERPMLVEVLS